MSRPDPRSSQDPAAPPAPTTPPGDREELFECWKQIGVEGDGSCRELRELLHCRNCPVYSKAALLLLDRKLPAEYREERTNYFAQKRKLASGNKISALIFRIGPEWLSLPTETIQEVAEHRTVHSIPHRRHGILLGVVNVRGELLLCVSVGRLLGLDHGASSEKLRTFYDRLLVVSWDGKRLAFPANEVRGIHRFGPDELAHPPSTVTRAALTFTRGILSWRERLVGLLDPDLLFSTLNRSLS